MKSNALEMAEAQRRADKAHHEKRIEWLMSEAPKWSCGSAVEPAERKHMLMQSKSYLANPAAGFNHCHCEPRCA